MAIQSRKIGSKYFGAKKTLAALVVLHRADKIKAVGPRVPKWCSSKKLLSTDLI